MSRLRAFQAMIKLSYEDEKTARAIHDAVGPDNENLPEGLRISSSTSGNLLRLEISCEKSLESFWATLDDLLACIQAAERAILSVAQEDPRT